MSHKLTSRKTIAVDLDGTLAEYDGWKGIDHIGHPIAGAQGFVRRLLEFADVEVYTTRTALLPDRPAGETVESLALRVTRWLRENHFPAEVRVYAGAGKPLVAAFIDDRAVSCRPLEVSPYINPGVVSADEIAAVAYDKAVLKAADLCGFGQPRPGPAFTPRKSAGPTEPVSL